MLVSSVRTVSNHHLWLSGLSHPDTPVSGVDFYRIFNFPLRLCEQAQQLIRRQRQYAEHQVRHYFVKPAYPDVQRFG